MTRSVILALLVSASALVAQDKDEQLRHLYTAGESALQAGQYAGAEQLFLQLRTLAPDTAEVHGRLGMVYFEEHKFELAAQSFRTALRLKPTLSKTDVLLAMADTELGRYRQALPALEKGFRQNSDGDLRRMCGLRLLRAQTAVGRDREAVATALELNRLAPDDPEVLYHTSRIYANFAYLNLQQLSSVAPQSVWRRQAAAEAFESAGNTELAISEYRNILKQQPTRAGIHYRIGRALLAGNKAPAGEALTEFRAELQVDASNANAAYEAAELSRKAGRLPEAETFFRQALASDNDFPEAQQGLAAVLLSGNKPSDALPLLKAAAAARPKDEVTFYRLAQAYRMLGDATAQARELAKYSQLRSLRRKSESIAGPDRVIAVTPQQLDEGAPASEAHRP